MTIPHSTLNVLGDNRFGDKTNDDNGTLSLAQTDV